MNALQTALLDWYDRDGREHLPWRVRRDPYSTIVSESMLQQTQVDRVVPAFERFIALFPDFAGLARASVADVLRAWKGLGYNSRAVRLKQLAEAAVERYAGTLPRETSALRDLPGVGPYTAAAVRAFAYDIDDAACDVNVRRVVHRATLGLEYPPRETVRELDARALALVPSGRAHDWNSALMDLGATICTARAPKCERCPLADHCSAAPIDIAALETARRATVRPASGQAALRFEETARFARGRIVDRLRALPPEHAISLMDLHHELRTELADRDVGDVAKLVAALTRDGLVEGDDSALRLRS